jgi:hypothetical protein
MTKYQRSDARLNHFDEAHKTVFANSDHSVVFTFAPWIDGQGSPVPDLTKSDAFKPYSAQIPLSDTRKSVINSWHKIRKDAATWLMSATDQSVDKKHKPQRNQLSAPHYDKKNNSTVSVNGFILHLVRAKVGKLPARLDPTDKTAFPDYTRIMPEYTESGAQVQVSTRDLLESLNVVRTIAQDVLGTCILEFTPERLTISASSPALGEIRAIIENGQDVVDYRTVKGQTVVDHHTTEYLCNGYCSIAVNCAKLITTLKGLGETVFLQVAHHDHPLYIISDLDGQTREAVIMPMHTQIGCRYTEADYVPARDSLRESNREFAANYAKSLKAKSDKAELRRQVSDMRRQVVEILAQPAYT